MEDFIEVSAASFVILIYILLTFNCTKLSLFNVHVIEKAYITAHKYYLTDISFRALYLQPSMDDKHHSQGSLLQRHMIVVRSCETPE